MKQSMKKIKISPSILSADFSQLGKEIKRLEEGGADMIHVDVMDGHFVPNLTMGPPIIKALRKYTKLPFDIHLMISPVHKFIEDYADAGADIITIHPEATDNLKDSIDLIKKLNKKVGISLNPETKINLVTNFLKEIDLILIMSVHPGFGGQKFIPKVLDKIKELKKKVGVSLNPETKVNVIKDYLNQIDLVLIMSVNPGFGGQKFMPEVLDKIKELKNIQKDKNIDFDIEIDGGINFENSKIAIKAGVDILVSGTTIFKENGGDLKKNIQLLRTG